MKPEILYKLQPVSLEEMSAARLMNRIDTKYLATLHQLDKLLSLVAHDYRVVEIEGERMMPYYTCYFDTIDAEMYYEHQRGKKARQKVRIRKYEGNSDLAFLEIKDKNNKGRTKKTRTEFITDKDITEYSDFISENSNYRLDSLIKHIENHFYRITLVRNDMSERVTIDSGIEFHNLITGEYVNLPQLVVIEWKRKAISESSPMKRFLKQLGIRESSFSKYVVGMAKTNQSLRINRIKKNLRKVSKILDRGTNFYHFSERS